MTELFGVPIDTFTQILLIITGIIVGGVLLLALTNALFFKIGIRNIPRRRMQMALIVFALMLSTTLLSSVMATGDVMLAGVQSVAIYNWGSVDELIEGGRGDLGLYRDDVFYALRNSAQHDPDIVALGAALRERNLLIADETSRQVRSSVTLLAVLPGTEQGFGGMQDQTTKRHLTIAGLPRDGVYLNLTLAQLLNAHRGDTLYLYSQRWPGRRYVMYVSGIVGNNGLVGDNSFMLGSLRTFERIERAGDGINQIFISNRGSGLAAISLTDQVSDAVSQWIPRNVHVIPVQQQGVQDSETAQSIFTRIFTLFALFSLAIGLLLIFLIFVLLAAERRAEMGMARAIGMQRRHLVLMFLFEGMIYDLLSSFVGLLVGIGAGALLVNLLSPLLQSFNFPLKLKFQPHSLIIAYCLGVIFTFLSVALSSWLVSRMTVVEAMRDQPEPSHASPSLGELASRLLQLLRQLSQAVAERAGSRRVRRILLELIPDVIIGFVRSLVMLGFLPLLAGLWLMQTGLDDLEIIPFSLGLSLVVIGVGLLLRAICERIVLLISRLLHHEPPRTLDKKLNALFAALMGLALLAYWALPFDALSSLGLPRFQGGIEIFFVAGTMMVLGAVWALVANAGLIVRPLLALCSRLPGAYAMGKLASAYPLHRRFRTSLSVIMFSLVVFAMAVMAVVTNAMQNTYVSISAQTGGYDIQATPYFAQVPDLPASLKQHGINPNAFTAIGMKKTTAVGVIQLGAQSPRWSLYPAQVVSGGFLQGYGLHLTARAHGFDSDGAVWQALQTHPNYALIDSSALPYNPDIFSNASVYDPNSPSANQANAPATPPGFDPQYTFTVSGVYQGEKSFPAIPVWVVGLQGHESMKLTIIGIVDNSDSAHFGLYIPQSTYSSASIGNLDTTGSNVGGVSVNDIGTPESQTYYFKIAPGQNKRALALKLGSAYLDYGLETTVLEDAILQVRGPRIFLSNVLLGVVGVTLLLGVAALAITGTRAVIERRQQIGMLRALGCSRRMVQGAFLLESFLVGVLGSILGVTLGLILARNVFAANFFEQYQTGLFFSVPWHQISIIVGVALLASLLGAILPAWQAGRVAPAEALRYQ
jgi:putative ABC transport system permease protein